LKKSYLAIFIVLLVLILDQALKIWVKTSFCYGEERALLGLSWAKLNFVENPGMAFGWKFGGEYGKLALSLFRLVAIGFLGYYIIKLIKKDVSTGLVLSFSLILAGAIGNIIDSAFYGLIFTESSFHCVNGPAKMFAAEGGYAGFLHGKVVDMLFFPLLKNANGEVFFFQPVFNIADSAITTGVISILLFQRNYFSSNDEQNEQNVKSQKDIAALTPHQVDIVEDSFEVKNKDSAALSNDNIESLSNVESIKTDEPLGNSEPNLNDKNNQDTPT
jgi:signal peptidase II